MPLGRSAVRLAMTGARYRYRHSWEASPEESQEQAGVETLVQIQESIRLLTGGCEICRHSDGTYCMKLRRHFDPGDPRCEFFSGRFQEDPTECAKAQAREFVYDKLGIRDYRTAERLLGRKSRRE